MFLTFQVCALCYAQATVNMLEGNATVLKVGKELNVIYRPMTVNQLTALEEDNV